MWNNFLEFQAILKIPQKAVLLWTSCGPMSKSPRLLCLHGAQSNGSMSDMQMMVIEASDYASCDCIDSAQIVAGKCDAHLEGPGRSWYIEGGSLRLALTQVVDYVEQHGPYDGVYAFSQGASIATILSDPGVWRSFGRTVPLWRFAVLACGTDSLLPKQTEPAMQPPIAIPSLHIRANHPASTAHMQPSLVFDQALLCAQMALPIPSSTNPGRS
jgi:hypothetical protein